MIKKFIDGKKVLIKGNPKNVPSMSIIKNVYSKIPDNKRIPIVFETKTQYLNEYIKNQEKVRGKPFPKSEVSKYKRTELSNMSNIVSRYTTKKNPYIDLRTVFFTDNKITPKQFTKSAFHEYGHEAWESKPSLRKDWSSVNKGNAPTSYGTTSKQEDLAESYMLYKTGGLRDSRRGNIITDNISQSRKSYRNVLPSVRKIMMAGGGAPEHIAKYEEGIREAGLDLKQFDMNNDGKINDADISIMRKKGMLKGIEKDPGKDSVADALGWDIPEGLSSTASWKLYGAPKKYDPRIQERGDLKGNIFRLTREHYQTVGRSPLLWTDSVSQNFGIIQGLQEDSPITGGTNILQKAFKSAYTGKPVYKGDTREQVHLTPEPVREGINWTADKYSRVKKALKYKPIDPTKKLPGPEWLQKITHPMTTAQQGVLLNVTPEQVKKFPKLAQYSEAYNQQQEIERKRALLAKGIYEPDIPPEDYIPKDVVGLGINTTNLMGIQRIPSGIQQKKAFILQ